MIDYLLSFIAPYLCFGCGKIGAPLCSNCKYNIEMEPFEACIVCGNPSSKNGVCIPCQTSYSRAWCVGERAEALQSLIDAYKFERAKACYKPLADLLRARLPDLPHNTIIVPVPTTASHIRQRGYDHTRLIARRLAKDMNLKLDTALIRRTATVQRGVSRRQRVSQAKKAFAVASSMKPNCPYLIIDDVVTTGSTLRYAAQALKDAGASDVWVAVIAHQSSTN